MVVGRAVVCGGSISAETCIETGSATDFIEFRVDFEVLKAQ